MSLRMHLYTVDVTNINLQKKHKNTFFHFYKKACKKHT